MKADLVESIEIETRGYELSCRGMIPPSAYLRYFEHLRWRMMANIGKLRFRDQIPMGVIRAQAIEAFDTVSFDERLLVTMWVSRLGRTSMDLSHELIRVRGEEVVARCTATLVALDHQRRPAPIDPSVRNFVLEKKGAAYDDVTGDAPPNAFEQPLQIRPSDQDLQQHVNQARYVDLIEDTRWFAAAANAYGSGDWSRPLKRITVSYESESRVGEPLVARTWPEGADSARVQLAVGDRAVVRARVTL